MHQLANYTTAILVSWYTIRWIDEIYLIRRGIELEEHFKAWVWRKHTVAFSKIFQITRKESEGIIRLCEHPTVLRWIQRSKNNVATKPKSVRQFSRSVLISRSPVDHPAVVCPPAAKKLIRVLDRLNLTKFEPASQPPPLSCRPVQTSRPSNQFFLSHIFSALKNACASLVRPSGPVIGKRQKPTADGRVRGLGPRHCRFRTPTRAPANKFGLERTQFGILTWFFFARARTSFKYLQSDRFVRETKITAL